ncbi:MAG: tetratricopeptide repeat protein [Acidobacteriota bacterium]
MRANASRNWAAEDPKRPEPHVGLGYIAWRNHKQSEGNEHFGKALALGANSPKLLWDFARMSTGTKPEEAEKALTALVDQEPKNAEYRMTLATLQMNRQKFAEALATIRPINHVTTTQERDRILYIRASAALRAGDRVEAKKIAEELKRLTTVPDFTAQAEEILRYLQQPNAGASPQRVNGVLVATKTIRGALVEVNLRGWHSHGP